MPSAPRPESLVMDWSWDTTYEFSGVEHRARWVPWLAPTWPRTLVVEGIPTLYVNELLAAAQATDTNPAWHVPVDAEPDAASRIERARRRLEYDLEVYATRFVTALGESESGALTLLGCGAVRPRISPEFESLYWAVTGRILVVPEQRGKRIASRLSMPFLAASQSLLGDARLGFVMETIAASAKKLLDGAAQGGLLDRVEIEPRRHQDTDDTSFLGFYPGARAWAIGQGESVLATDRLPPGVASLVEQVHDIWLHGGSTKRCARAARDFADSESALLAAEANFPAIAIYRDFLGTLSAWGVLRTEEPNYSSESHHGSA